MNEIDNSQSDDEIDLAQLFHQIWAKKHLVLIITLICLGLSACYILIKSPTYKSDVILKVEEKDGVAAGLMSGDAVSLLGMNKQNNAIAAESALIKSRFILAPVIEQMGLNIFSTPKAFFLKKMFKPSDASIKIKDFKVPTDELGKPLILKLTDNHHYQLLDSKQNIVLSGEVGQNAQNTSLGYALHLSEFKGSAGQAFVLKKLPMTDVIDGLNKKLSIEQLDTKRSETGLMSLSLKGKNKDEIIQILNQIALTSQQKNAERKSLEASSTLSFLKRQLPIAKKSLAEAEIQLNRYKAETGKINIDEQAKLYLERLSDLDNQLATLRIKKIGMNQHYTEEHPSTISIKNQINEIEKEKYRMEKLVRVLPESDQKLIALMRDVKIKTSLYTGILSRIQEFEVMNAGTVSDVRILDWAQIPDHPLPSKNALILLGSIIFGVMLSCGYILGRRMLFPMVQDPTWIEKRFNLPNLAIIPFASEQRTIISEQNQHTADYTPLLAKIDPRSLAIEGLRSLRTSLQINLSCAKNNIISIMGITPGVGKSFISSNLAYLLASSGKKVLLIDGDLRKGTVHKQYGIKASPGFTELLQQQIPITEVLQHKAHEHLTIMTRGAYPNDPSELLSQQKCQDVLNELSAQFDVVVIDTPPVLLVTDPMILGAYAGTNFLVIGADSHRPTDVEMAVKKIQVGGVQLLGTIFNCQTAASQISINHTYYYNSYYDDKDIPRREKALG